MDKKIFLQNIKQQFEDNEIVIDFFSNFKDQEYYDSLIGMSIMVMIQDEYNYKISHNDYHSIDTVEGLYDFILKNK
jgi:acyl carrier protein